MTENGTLMSVRVGQVEVGIKLDDYVDGRPTSVLFVLAVCKPGVAGVVKIPGRWKSEQHALYEVEPKALDWARRINSLHN